MSKILQMCSKLLVTAPTHATLCCPKIVRRGGRQRLKLSGRVSPALPGLSPHTGCACIPPAGGPRLLESDLSGSWSCIV